MLGLHLNSPSGTNIAGIRLALNGGGADTDIGAAAIYDDVNDNLVFDNGTDMLLGRGQFIGGLAFINFPVSFNVPAGMTENLLVLFNIAPQATTGVNVGAAIFPTDIQLGDGDPIHMPVSPATSGLPMINAGTIPRINSMWQATGPTADGNYGAGEHTVSIGQNTFAIDAVAGNNMTALLIVENNATHLWVTYDAVRDFTNDANDRSAFSLDTDNNDAATLNEDDQFQTTPADHLQYDGAIWSSVDLCAAPGLVCAAGYGPSPNSGTPHRIYEYQIPFSLIGVTEGDTMGFRAANENFGGVMDISSTFNFNSWPQFNFNIPPLIEYADLVLATSNNPPVAFDLGVQGYMAAPGILHITDPTPDLNWTYNDTEGDPQSQYDLRVGSSPGASDMWNPPATPGAALMETYAGAALVRGTDYYFGVMVNDGISWSTESEVMFHVNSIPNPPTTPISPLEASTIPASATQTVSWTSGGDNEGDAETYEWQVATDTGFTTIIASGTTTNTVSAPFTTVISTPYYWRVNASDSYEPTVRSPYGNMPTGYWTFTTSAVVNNPPVASDLGVQGFMAPPGILHITDPTPDLNWTYSDPNGDPQSQYDLRVGSSPGASDMWDPPATPGAALMETYAGAALVRGTDYYFGVMVNDGITWGIESEVMFHVNSIPNPPTTPISPLNASTVLAGATQTVSWTSGGDNEGDTLTYEWQVATDTGFTMIVDSGTTTGTTSTQFATVISTDYYWRVRASDTYEPTVWSQYGNMPTGYWTFTTSAVVNSPPVLSATGEANYVGDGLDPETGLVSTNFVYRVNYTDANDDPPLGGVPQVHILKGGSPITGSPFDMTAVDITDIDYTDGKLYTHTETLTVVGSDYTYYFTASDINGAPATNWPSPAADAPDVTAPPTDGSISGVIKDKNGDLIDDADVTLVNSSGDEIGTTTTDSNGNYVFNNVPPGTDEYSITVGKTGYNTRTIDDIDVSTATTTWINATLSASARIDGKVVQPDGTTGIADATVELLDEDGIVVKTTQTDNDGNFEFTELDYGNYKVRVKASGYEDKVTADFITINKDNLVESTDDLQLVAVEPEEGGIGDYWWIIVIIVIVIVVLLLLILLMRRRKKGPDIVAPPLPLPPEMVEAEGAAPPPPSAPGEPPPPPEPWTPAEPGGPPEPGPDTPPPPPPPPPP
jgi:hypothetical protein